MQNYICIIICFLTIHISYLQGLLDIDSLAELQESSRKFMEMTFREDVTTEELNKMASDSFYATISSVDEGPSVYNFMHYGGK